MVAAVNGSLVEVVLQLQDMRNSTPVATGVQEIIVTGPDGPTLKTLDDLAGQEVYVQRSRTRWYRRR